MPSRPPIPVELEAEIRRWVRDEVSRRLVDYPNGIFSVAPLARRAYDRFYRRSNTVTRHRMYRIVDEVLSRDFEFQLWNLPPSKRKYVPPQAPL